MNCKDCHSPLDENSTICPVCGADNAASEDAGFEEEPETEALVTEETEPEAAAPEEAEEPEASGDAGETEESGAAAEDEADTAQDAQPSACDAAPAPKKRKNLAWLFVVLGVVAALVLAMLTYNIVYVLQNKDNTAYATPITNEAGEQTGTKLTVSGVFKAIGDSDKAILHNIEVLFNPYASLVTDKDVYSISSATPADKSMQKVIAVCGDTKLTAGEFQIYYLMQYYDFMNEYGSYASMFGLDSTKPLSEQASMAENMTWEQYFVDSAMTQYKQYAAACEKAAAEGYEFDPEFLTFIEQLPEQLESEATTNGYDSALAYIQGNFGPGTSVEDYVSYVKTYYTAMLYDNSLYSALDYTDEEISNYYDANAEEYLQNGVEKTDIYNVSVRHILIQPADADGDGTSTDEEWAAAEATAQELYSEYLADPTEENFSALASANSSDEGSSSNGGLYEDVYPNQMVAEFNDWCFDTARLNGDTAIVKTTYGYHIMYFVGQADTIHWVETALADYRSETMQGLIEQMQTDYPTKVNYKAIVLVELPQA